MPQCMIFEVFKVHRDPKEAKAASLLNIFTFKNVVKRSCKNLASF